MSHSVRVCVAGCRVRTRRDQQKRDMRADQRRRDGRLVTLQRVRPTETVGVAELLRVVRPRVRPVRVEPVVTLSRRLPEGDSRLRNEVTHGHFAIAPRSRSVVHRPAVGDPGLPHTAVSRLRLGVVRQRWRHLPPIRRARGLGMWVRQSNRLPGSMPFTPPTSLCTDFVAKLSHAGRPTHPAEIRCSRRVL